jgi:hypothetical protein
MKRLTMLLVLAPLLLSGCAPNPSTLSQVSLKPGASRFIAYREAGLTAAFAGPSMYVNGQELGKLYQNTCFEIALEPGEYEIKFEGSFFNWPGPARAMRVALEPNTTRFVELVVSGGGGPAMVNHFYVERSQVLALRAIRDIGECTK